MVPEASLEETEYGHVAAGDGWFVLKRTRRHLVRPKRRGRGAVLERRGGFDQVGISIDVLGPGEPMAMYHWETTRRTSSCSQGRRR